MAERYSTGESIEDYSKKCCEIQTLITQDNYFNEVTFTCNICNESVKSAMFLNCLHSFCAECVDKKLKAGKDDTESPPAEKCIGQPHLTCPLCPDYDNLSVKLHSNPFPQLITSLKDIRYKLQLGESLKCADCLSGNKGKQAIAYCIECDTVICQIDLRGHQKFNITHHTFPLESIQNSTVKQILNILDNKNEDMLTAVTSGTVNDFSQFGLQKSPKIKTQKPKGRSKKPHEFTPAETTGVINEQLGHQIIDSSQLTETQNNTKSKQIANEGAITAIEISVETECIKEASDKIAQLEASKLKLENEWDSQVRQVVTFFEDLQKEIEQRRATLLQELSDLYQELMSPLEKRIQHLEQTISYTQYISALKNYDYITGLQGTTDYKLSDISDTVVNFKLPPPSYIIQLNQQAIATVTSAVNAFVTIAKVNQTEATVKEIPLFKKRRFHAMTLNKYITVEKAITPVAVTIDNSATNIFYILFDSYINQYQLVHTSLILKQTIKLGGHTADISHSAMTVTADSIVILISNQFHLYSKKDGEYKSQLTTANYGYNFTYPKMYYFPGIPLYFYTSTLVSPIIYLVDATNGANQGSINFSQSIHNIWGNIGVISLIDIALCPTNATQIFILCSCASPQNQQVTYYIQIYYSGMNFLGVASLNQQLSPFCCFIPRKDELYLLDASTGHTYVFDPQNYAVPNQYYDMGNHFGRRYDMGNQVGRQYGHTTWDKIRTEESSFNKATDLEGKLTKDYPVQAFSAEQKIILFCGGNIQIIM